MVNWSKKVVEEVNDNTTLVLAGMKAVRSTNPGVTPVASVTDPLE
jgi:hypothetical protein